MGTRKIYQVKITLVYLNNGETYEMYVLDLEFGSLGHRLGIMSAIGR